MSNSTSSSGSTASGSFYSTLIWAACCDRYAGVRSSGGGVVRNRTSLSVHAGSANSIAVQPADYSKDRPALWLSNNLPFGGMLMARPSWSAARSGPLWHYKGSSL